MTFLEELEAACRERPATVAIRYEGRQVRYAELGERVNRTAHALRGAGVSRGDRVTLALGNSIEWLVSAFGTLCAGAVIHPVNPALGRAEVAWLLEHADPALVVVDPASARPVREAAGPRRRIGSWTETPATDLRLDEESARHPATPPGTRPGPDDGSLLLYTSGTTGTPKGVLFDHQRTGSSGRLLVKGLGIREDDTILFVGPLFHGNAWSGAMCAVQAGCTVAFPATFHASEFWRLAHDTGATVLFTLGTVLAILLAQPEAELERTSRLRTILGLGSAPIRDRLRERFGVADVVECFGSTDAGVVTLEPRGVRPRAGSSGPPLPGVELRIADDDGREVPTGGVGEITVRSPHRMREYFRDPERTREAVCDGWFLTGDLGRLDQDGWLYFVDRKRDVIRRGGENVSSVFVEKTLREHPDVVEAAVIGVPDPVLGQEIKAYVVCRRTVSAAELERFAGERLARFQVPRLWDFPDSLPKTPTQRIEKYKLRAESGDTGEPRLG